MPGIQDTPTHAVDCSSLVPCFVYPYDCNVIPILSMLYGLLLYGVHMVTVPECKPQVLIHALMVNLFQPLLLPQIIIHTLNQSLYVCSKCIVWHSLL